MQRRIIMKHFSVKISYSLMRTRGHRYELPAINKSLQNIQCDNMMEGRRPGIVVIDKKGGLCTTVDIAVPADRGEEGKKN